MTHTAAAALATMPQPPLPRRSFLHLAGAGLATGVMLPRALADHGNEKSPGTSHATIQLVRRFINVAETRDSPAIWSMFADDGIFEFPFINLRVTDLASFEDTVGLALSLLDGLRFTDLSFIPLTDPNAVIAKYRGHATVSFTGKPYEQTYITEVRVRNGRLTLWSEYYDTAAFNESFTP